jgi:predicted component of type VI protein secretion system
MLCDICEMNTLRLVSVIVLVSALLAGCGSSARSVERANAPDQEGAAGVAVVPAADSLLSVEALNADRMVQPGAEEVFDIKVVNATEQPMPVVIALERAEGQRWRTSLCVEKQCLLGDGSEPSVTDPVILPPYLEQVFKARLFVDGAARSGQETLLTLRINPLIEAAMPRSVILSAHVRQP